MKYILFMFLFINLLFGDVVKLNLFKQKDLNLTTLTTEAEKLIKEIKKEPIVIEKKKKIKVITRKYSDIDKDIDSNLDLIKNISIDLKVIISDIILNKKTIKESLPILKSLKIKDFTKKFDNDISFLKNNKFKEKLIKKNNILKVEIINLKKIISELIKKYENDIQLKESTISIFKIDKVVLYFNEKLYKVNPFLTFFSLDIGRVIVFIFSIIIFILFGILLHFILRYLFSKLSKVGDEDDISNNNFHFLKVPLMIYFFLLGFQIGIEIILYPKTIPIFIALFFSTINTIVLVFIFNKLIDISLFIATHKEIIKIKKTELINIFSRGLKIISFFIGVIYILSTFGVDTERILTSLGIVSLAIGFALKDIIIRFFSGLKIIFDESFSAGDWVYFIELGKKGHVVDGTVIEVGFINTRIRTWENSLLVIPNFEITEKSYINWTRRKLGRKISLQINVKYSSKKEDLEKSVSDIREMLATHPEMAPISSNYNRFKVKKGKYVSIGDEIGLKNILMVQVVDFGEFSFVIDVFAFTKTVQWNEWRNVKQDVIFKILDIFKDNHIELAYPTQTIQMDNDFKNEAIAFDTE